MKYDIDDQVTAKKELITYTRDEDTGEEYENLVPMGAHGVIESTGKSSVHNFNPMYNVLFKFDGNEVEVTFFEDDLEETCTICRRPPSRTNNPSNAGAV